MYIFGYIGDRKRELSGFLLPYKDIIIVRQDSTEKNGGELNALIIDCDTDNDKIPNIKLNITMSCYSNTIALLAERKVPVITCGMMEKDTFTLSGVLKGVSVSLQRGIQTLDGSYADPEEITVPSTGYDSDIVLLGSCVLVLCGIFPPKSDSFI